MLNLKLDEIPEEGLDLKWKEEPVVLSEYIEHLSKIDFKFENPLQSEAKIRRVSQSILIKGDVQTLLRLQCVRCLKEFSYPLASAFELTLHPLRGESLEEELELSGEEGESNSFEGGEIHLSEIACEQIFLEIPVQPLCHEACKGLCTHCGQNLNLSSCDCVKEEFGSGFSILQKMKLH
ncbi:MAG: DUF177 domain-containing protein [Thermodesulfobacteriota bacterium]|nr:DUF177 domain-containing protein [Thermodesulfobacteriota bacterium]